MKVLFLYPNKVMVTRVPLGICHLSSYLKSNGHDVKVYDTTFIKCGNVQNDEELRAASLQVINSDFRQYELIERKSDAHAEFEKEVDSFKPDVIAMSVVDPNYNFGVELLRRVKNKHKDIKTIVGGQTDTYAPDEVIAEDCIDHEVLKQALYEKKVTRYGDGQELREYIHVVDAARLSVKVLSDYENQYVIIAGQQSIKIKDLMTMIKEMFDNKIEVEFQPGNSRYHYEITPYTFKPNLAVRILDSRYVDLGQGLLDILHDLQKQEHKAEIIAAK